MDKFRIDSHKLMYHVDRVVDWLDGEHVFPVYLEISPSGACNHRCKFCAIDYMAYRKRFLELSTLKLRLTEMKQLGIKSIMYAGEGEPLLHQNFTDIVDYTKRTGIDVAVTSNGVFLNKEQSKKILGSVEWIKISINAGDQTTYSKIHRCTPEDFNIVIRNMSDAVKIKDEEGYDCTLGMQMVLLPDNQKEVVALAKIAKDIGVDYLAVKPYSQHLMSKTTRYNIIRYQQFSYLENELAQLNSDDFHVVFRINAMGKWDCGLRNYDYCLALPFWSYVDAGGNVWGCSAYLGDERFCYGNINDKSFKEIWEGCVRMSSLGIRENFHATECRLNCRMDEVNRYLRSLKHPQEHVNFI